MNWPSLLTAIALMLGGTAYPLAFARADGSASHSVAMLVLWSMSAGFVHGVGFVPRHRIARLLLSGWACALALAAGAALALVHR
jgi:predicted membrane protein